MQWLIAAVPVALAAVLVVLWSRAARRDSREWDQLPSVGFPSPGTPTAAPEPSFRQRPQATPEPDLDPPLPRIRLDWQRRPSRSTAAPSSLPTRTLAFPPRTAAAPQSGTRFWVDEPTLALSLVPAGLPPIWRSHWSSITRPNSWAVPPRSGAAPATGSSNSLAASLGALCAASASSSN